MTTINPVSTSITQTPAFKGKMLKAQQKDIKAFRDILIKELAKTNPERAKDLIIEDLMSKITFKSIVKFLVTGKLK